MSVETRAQRITQRINEAIGRAATGLDDGDYKELLEEVGAEVEGRLDALREEHPELWE